ncbi:UNKNOWN [Stylonychia lemnae]|uniref:Uncharacterized protein n=1 Tax=Stylonychia lemnae TaxID=5949 RepID=A0A078A0S8_STYLE|nr:UNKNOWN [Stylonychia lemnae]|eukprot:CDW74389.1 UNKNOWN [Stylonychia lemnae]
MSNSLVLSFSSKLKSITDILSSQFRAKMRRKNEEMKKAIQRGLKDLADHSQKDLLADLLETYYMEHVKKTNEVDDYFYEQLIFAFEHGDNARMENLFERVIEFTRNQNKELSRLLALRYQQQQKYALAYGYSGELDLFIARTQLDLIVRCENFDGARKIKKHFAREQTPLLNYTDMLQELIQIGDFALFKETKDKYDSQIDRDPTFLNGLMKLLNGFFGGN